MGSFFTYLFCGFGFVVFLSSLGGLWRVVGGVLLLVCNDWSRKSMVISRNGRLEVVGLDRPARSSILLRHVSKGKTRVKHDGIRREKLQLRELASASLAILTRIFNDTSAYTLWRSTPCLSCRRSHTHICRSG